RTLFNHCVMSVLLRTARVRCNDGLSSLHPAEPKGTDSLDRYDFARAPGLVKPGLKRAIKTQHRVPSFIGYGLNPIAFLAGRRLGSEIKSDRSVLVLDKLVTLVVLAGERLAGLQFGACLRVVNHHGPEVLGRYVGRNRQ